MTKVATRSAAPAKAEYAARALPKDAPATIKIGKLTASKVAQTADMVRYVVHLKGKPTFIDVMAKYNPGTALPPPDGAFEGRKALVLADRDGVLNKAASFLNKPADVTEAAMIPAALQGAKALDAAGIGLVIVTNQGGYQAGKMSFEDTVAVNVRVAQRLANAGGRVDAILVCPFSDALTGGQKADVDARKPGPGMPVHAIAMAKSLGVPVAGMVGDQRTDGAAAQAAGLKFFAITDTVNGRWEAELASAEKKHEKLPTLKEGAAQLAYVADFGAGVTAAMAGLKSPAPPIGDGLDPSTARSISSEPIGVFPESHAAPKPLGFEALATSKK